jgi:ABC-type sugar transport system ATPase subunit
LEELVEGSARVVILRDGRAVAEFPHAVATQARIIQAMAGEDEATIFAGHGP